MSLNLDKSNWARVRFGDIARNVTERVDDPQKAGVDRYVGLEHLDPGVLTVQRWDSPAKVAAQKLRFYPGDVIFGRRRAYQKKVAMAQFEGICSAHALVLRAQAERVHPDFLPIFLSSDYFLDRAISISVGSLSPTVNWRDLSAQEFGLPPLDEQKRIADLLWTLERHREQVKGLCSRIAGATGEIFEHLAERARGSHALRQWVTRIDAGRSPRASSEPAAGSEYGVLKVSAVGRDRFEPNENKRLLDAGDFRPSDAVRAGNVLVTRANAVIENVARPCIVDRDFPNLMLSDKTLRLVPAPRYPARVVLAALNSRAYRAHVREAVNGTEAKNISQSRILQGPVPDFGEDIVALLETHLAALDDASIKAHAERANLNALRVALLVDIFGGAA